MLTSGLAYLTFVLLAVVGPGVALLRLARVRIDTALVLPMGLAACAGAYWLALVLGAAWLFPALALGLDLTLLVGPRPRRLAGGPSLRGALPALAAAVVVFALAEFPLNRKDARGAYVFDNVVPEDLTFHAALAWELTAGFPPQVPGLSGEPMGYHNGLPLVRAAAVRYAGVHPYDQISRFELPLAALTLILALRAVTGFLGGGPLALVLVGWTILATDFSFLFALHRNADLWLNLTDANLLFSVCHANSSVHALAIALGVLVALERHAAGEGRGWLLVAALLGFAVPHFKAFVAAQYGFGLGLAALLARRWVGALVGGVPAALGLLAVVAGRASSNMEILVHPLTIVQKLRAGLALPAASGGELALWTLLWVGASLGLRILGVPGAVRALGSSSGLAVALSAMALCGWPIGLLFRVTPLEFPGRPPYNEAWYFIEQSGPVLWIFAVLALERLAGRGARAVAVVAGAALLSFPSSVQFVRVKRATPPVVAPPAIVEAMDALAREGRPGDVVIVKPEPKRYPPPPMVLVGRRIPYTRFIPYLYQVAPPADLRVRLEEVRRFFHTEDPAEALALARGLGATHVCLFGDDALGFPVEGVLRTVYERPNARVYALPPAPLAVTPPPLR
ncbi:MAG: hypothetical protein HY317_06060 [Acidobacteria bacterium]|nr:hypothetical protein [Acidobacteriota bacterium]